MANLCWCAVKKLLTHHSVVQTLRFTQLHILYSSLTRSKLDYCCVVYGSARASYHKMLDPIHNRALRLCLGAFRTSPAISLYVEATEPPLAFRRFSPYQPSSNWSYETHQFLSSKRRESTRMSNLPFSSPCQAHFDRLHLFQCSTSVIFWSWHTQRTFLKMSNLERLLLLLKIQTFIIVYNVGLY